LTDLAFLQTRWRVRALLVSNLAAFALLATWRWAPMRALWDRLDVVVFHLLNPPLAGNPTWAGFWGVCNMRPVDIVFGLVMLAFLARGGWIIPRGRGLQSLYAFVVVLVLLLLIRAGPLNEAMKAFNWQRASPSLTEEGAVRLVSLFPAWERDWHMKDASIRSFPGDHASVLIAWALLLSYAARGWHLWLVWAFAALFMLPRLVSGAHWLSDDLVGGVFVALMAVGWGTCTPLAARVSAMLERLSTAFLRRFAPFLGLRRGEDHPDAG